MNTRSRNDEWNELKSRNPGRFEADFGQLIENNNHDSIHQKPGNYSQEE
jgi:hypothetical protein